MRGSLGRSNRPSARFDADFVAKIGGLSAISFVLYMFVKFPLPIFPSFLDMQISELPAILAGFSLGPFAGALVIAIKCLIKLPFTSTAYVGELTDMILGMAYVIPPSMIYARRKTKKTAVVGLVSGTLIAVSASMLINRFVSVPFFVRFFFGNDFDGIIGAVRGLYPGVDRHNFYSFYIFAGVLPFNLLRLSVVSLIAFAAYKKLSKFLRRSDRATAIDSSALPDRPAPIPTRGDSSDPDRTE